MRTSKIFFVIFSLLTWGASLSFADEPPFYMMSFFEFQEVSPAQKSYYLERLNNIPSLQMNNDSLRIQTSIKKAIQDEELWQNLIDKVNTACSLSINQRTCKHLIQIRLNTFFSQSRANIDDQMAESQH